MRARGGTSGGAAFGVADSGRDGATAGPAVFRFSTLAGAGVSAGLASRAGSAAGVGKGASTPLDRVRGSTVRLGIAGGVGVSTAGRGSAGRCGCVSALGRPGCRNGSAGSTTGAAVAGAVPCFKMELGAGCLVAFGSTAGAFGGGDSTASFPGVGVGDWAACLGTVAGAAGRLGVGSAGAGGTVMGTLDGDEGSLGLSTRAGEGTLGPCFKIELGAGCLAGFGSTAGVFGGAGVGASGATVGAGSMGLSTRTGVGDFAGGFAVNGAGRGTTGLPTVAETRGGSATLGGVVGTGGLAFATGGRGSTRGAGTANVSPKRGTAGIAAPD